MRRSLRGLARATGFVLCLGSALAPPAQAGSLQVAPVIIEVKAPAAAGIVRLRNEGAEPLTAQVRLFKWTQVGGEEKLEPAVDVVASPPLAKMDPKSDYAIRLVRTSKAPLSGEESYRLVVDELPVAGPSRQNAVKLVMRHSIPVFFRSDAAGEPSLDWNFERAGGLLYLRSTNNGDRRARIAALRLSDQSGNSVTVSEGLVGYVLSGSAMRWALPKEASRLKFAGGVLISAQGDRGAIDGVGSLTTP